ncbi:MAG: HDOD domain-containing protein [Phycisphaeraceae bacterium]|nr:MAG: HDOD domain-containing protein [Phycisphaeraceae bacterium]
MKTRSELSAKEVEVLQQTLMRRLGDTSVPTLPQVALKVIELVSNPDSTIKQFAEVIRTDQALTGRLLRMANSASYAQRRKVTNIERAMVLMGIDRIKAVALGFHLSKAAASDKSDLNSSHIWAQSLFRGWLALRIAEKVNREIAAEAFIVNLMADAGLPMMPKLLGEAYRNAVPSGTPPAKRYLNENTALPFTHVDVTAAMARIWNLPDILRIAMSQHHTPPQGVSLSDAQSSLQAITYFCNLIPLDAQLNAQVDDRLVRHAERLFKISDADLNELVIHAAQDLEACRALFTDVIDESVNIDYIVEAANRQLGCEGSEEHSAAAFRKCLSFCAGEFQYQIESADNNSVVVYIADAEGNRILSEQINPTNLTEARIRETLMLDNAPSDRADEILKGIHSLAA